MHKEQSDFNFPVLVTNQKSDNLTLLRELNSDFEIDIGMLIKKYIFIDGIMAVISTQWSISLGGALTKDIKQN